MQRETLSSLKVENMFQKCFHNCCSYNIGQREQLISLVAGSTTNQAGQLAEISSGRAPLEVSADIQQ